MEVGMRPSVIVSPHPLMPSKEREIIFAEFLFGESIGEYLIRNNLIRRFGLDGRRPVICTVQGHRVPFAMWPHVRPKRGTLIEFHAALRGGNGDGNKIGRTLGLILVTALTIWTAGAATPAYGQFGAALIAAGVSMVGGLVVNNLFPPPKPHTPDLGDTSPTYALSGGSNQIRRFEPMPRIIGTHIIFPDFGAQPYNEFRGEDQFALYVFNLGYNDVTLSDFKLGETPLSSYSGVTLEESGIDGKLNLFPGNVDTLAGEELTNTVSWIQRTSSVDATQLAVEITGLLFAVNTQGDVVSNAVVIEINYRKVGSSTWIQPTIQSDDTTQYVNSGNSGWIGGIIRMVKEEAVRNVNSTPGQILIVNSNRKPLRRTYMLQVEKGQYEVRVKKVSADSTDDKDIKDIVWSQLRTYQPDEADYSGQKRLALQVRATGQISGQLPSFSCIARAKVLPPDFGYLGSLDSPTVAFDFTKATLSGQVATQPASAAIALARSTPGTRVNAQGLIELVGVDVPRFDYDPVTKVCKGILVEEQRQNLCVQSNAFTTTPWSYSVDAVQNQIGPDGLVSAWLLTDDRTDAWEAISQSITVANDSLTHVYSFYVKKTVGVTNTVGVNYTLFGGTLVGTNQRLNTNSGNATGGGYVEDCGAFWRLVCPITNNSSGNTSLGFSFYPATGVNSGDYPGTDDMAATGSAVIAFVNIEKALKRSSYIPTTTTQATRNQDFLGIVSVSDFYNESEGSVYAEILPSDLSVPRYVWAFSDGTINERVGVYAFNNAVGEVEDGGAYQGGVNSGTLVADTISRIAFGYKLNDVAISGNGAAVGVDTSATMPTVTKMYLGANYDGVSNAFIGHIRRFAYYPNKLSNATLQALATNGPAAFAREESSNPAWWYLDALRGQILNNRRIWGANAADSLIDVTNIQSFSDWCVDEELTVNAIIDRQMSVFDVLQMIALNGRATPSWGTGKLGVVWDAPNLPITAVFGMQNIVAASFSIQYATEDIADVIEGEFINPEIGWQKDVVRTVVPGATSQINSRRVQLFGRTDKVLAAQDTNLYAANNAYRTRSYKWQTDWEGMPCARGDVVQLSHDLASLDYSGRLLEGSTTTTLVLPRKVPLYTAGAFIVIIKPDGSYATYPVNGGAGETDTLTPSSALPFNPGADANHPEYDYRWLYGPTATPGKKVKIDSIRPIDERYVEISAVDELDIFYTAKDNPYSYTPPTPVFGGNLHIKTLTLTPEGVRAGTGYLVKVLITWEIEGSYSASDVVATIGDNPPVMIARGTPVSTAEVTMTDGQSLKIEVTAYSSLGSFGPTAKKEVTEFINFAALKAPSDVPEFFIAGKVFTWAPASEADVIGYQIRFHLGDKRTWEDASPLHLGLITEHDWEASALPLDDTLIVYFIKAVDAAQQYSVNPAIIVKGIGDPGIGNPMEVFDYRDLSWPGTITGGSISGGSIVANTSTLFYGTDDAAPLYQDSDDELFYPPAVYSDLEYITPVVYATTPKEGSSIVVQHVMVGNSRYLDWRRDGVGNFYSPTSSDPLYTGDSNPLYNPASEWIAWTGARMLEPGDRFQFRMSAAGGDVQAIFSELVVTIDAATIEEELTNVVISSAGTRLPITKDYATITSVQATLEFTGSSAVTFTIEDRNPDLGPRIMARDKDGAAVSGRGDFRVKGY